jgi:hypothetical protein
MERKSRFNKVFHKHPNAKGVGLFLTKAQVEGWVDNNCREHGGCWNKI